MLFTFQFIIFCSFGQSTYKQNILNIATIDFPEKPDFIDTLGLKMYDYSDENAQFILMIRDLSSQPDLSFQEDDLEKFYSNTIAGIIDASEGKILNKKVFELDGLKGVEIEFISNSNPSLPDLRFEKILFVNNLFIAVDFVTNSVDSMITKNKKDQYFQSFILTAKKSTLKQLDASNKDKAYKTGFAIGKVLGYLFVIGIVFLIVILINKVRNRKPKEWKT